MTTEERKKGRCWWLSPHQWTMWSGLTAPKELGEIQYRLCLKCGRYQQHWVQRKVVL